MNHRLQWSKVRNDWVIWEKGSWREWGWRRGNGDFSFYDSGSYLILMDWWEKGAKWSGDWRSFEIGVLRNVSERKGELELQHEQGWLLSTNSRAECSSEHSLRNVFGLPQSPTCWKRRFCTMLSTNSRDCGLLQTIWSVTKVEGLPKQQMAANKPKPKPWLLLPLRETTDCC